MIKSWIYVKIHSKCIAMSHVPKISFLCMCWLKSFKRCRAKLLEVACNYLVFKLNALVTSINISFGGEISGCFFEFRSLVCASVNWPSIASLHQALPAGANCKFMQLWDLQISKWVYKKTIKQEGLHRDS